MKGGAQMSKKVLEALTLSADVMKALNEKTEKLEAQGVQVNEVHSGELNFAGCASGYCQAWD